MSEYDKTQKLTLSSKKRGCPLDLSRSGYRPTRSCASSCTRRCRGRAHRCRRSTATTAMIRRGCLSTIRLRIPAALTHRCSSLIATAITGRFIPSRSRPQRRRPRRTIRSVVTSALHPGVWVRSIDLHVRRSMPSHVVRNLIEISQRSSRNSQSRRIFLKHKVSRPLFLREHDRLLIGKY